MARGGHLGFEVFIQNTAPLNPAAGDFWFDTSGGTVLNFRSNSNSWVAVAIPTAALDTLSNSVSVLSNAVSVISQSLSALSNAVSVISQQQSVLSNAQSVLSNAVSVLSQNVSALSNAVSVLSNQVSVLSQIHSALSQAVSVISQQVSVISVQVASAISLHNALSNVVSLVSVRLDTISNIVSSYGRTGQLLVVANTQGVSSTAAAGVAISGLSIALSAGGVYQVNGLILYQMSAADAFGVSFTFPGMVVAHGEIEGANATGVSTPLNATFNEDASNSIVYSAVVAVAVSTIAVKFNALFAVSTAGTLQANARVSATTKPANILKGSHIRSFQIA